MGDMFYRNNTGENERKKSDSLADIRGANVNSNNGGTENVSLEKLVALLPKAQREKIFSGYDAKGLAVIFEDGEMMRTAKAFLACGMNVSETARILYMHRNTLMYRLNAIKRRTGLDLKNFDDAVAFEILRILYFMK